MDGDGSPLSLPRRRVPEASHAQRTENFVQHMKIWMDICASRTMIRVEGFNTSSDRLVLYRALKDLFEPCGEVEHIEIRVDPESKLIRSCLVNLLGQGAKEKALLLNGSKVGERTLTLSAVEPTDGLTTSVRAAKYVANFQKNRSEVIRVTGYDPSLPQEDLKSALFKHFAACGEITDIFVRDSYTLVHLYGLGSLQRAAKLHQTDIGGGFTLSVETLPFQAGRGFSGTSDD
ncbi:RNA-binding (RRM/RBD/RNP motifs) family protein [Raphanus sativus]|uniref:Nucleolin 1-like n=1 Tax=Raphanus sativus TaxID=3726 RepID=A0A6J0NTD0_RAPSA|nr:nucleolin 1-like [Raphanus sativus]KAJ4894495.1 RNA-binding (RRM/RBD/RNP motifs) family protein [Raphanus sativus]